MINKKADIKLFGGALVNILIAVLGIGIIIIVAINVFNMWAEKSEMEKAEANLNTFIAEHKAFMDSSEASHDFIILGPKNWFLTYFDVLEETPPKKCGGIAHCICFCKYESKENRLRDCGENGVCKELGSTTALSGNKIYVFYPLPYKITFTKPTIQPTK